MVNSVVVRDFERAIDAADFADARLAHDKETGPLHGLPMTVKEAFQVEGLVTTWGYPEHVSNISTQDADYVRLMRRSGAHILGKTNVPKALMDYQSFNEIYGTTNNPWNLKLIPGGSSGGAAAALAAGLTGLAAGSDIGGSIRNPAHYCGVYGHKPTFGIVSQRGHSILPYTPALDLCVVGPMARAAEDLRISMEIVAGAEAQDRRGWTLDLPRPKKKKLADYRVAFWCDDPNAEIEAEVSDRIQSLCSRLDRLGATVSDSARPDYDVESMWRTYLYLLRGALAEASDEDFEHRLQANASLDPNDDSTSNIFSHGSVQYHRDWLGHHRRREAIRAAWGKFFEEWDILICPTVPTTALPHDQSAERTILINGKERSTDVQLFWSGIMNLAHLPSTVFPTGLSTKGLPIGLQAISAEYNDYVCIDFARLMAEEIGGFVPPSGYDDFD